MKATELELVCEGVAASVRLTSEAAIEWRRLLAATDTTSITERAHMQRHFRNFSERERHTLNDQQFKKQGRYSDSIGGEASIWCFKAYQWRLYGVIISLEGRRCFVGTKVDPSKKTNRADATLLRRAALIAGTIDEYASGKEKKDGKGSRKGRRQ